jgi:hypothetical protein
MKVALCFIINYDHILNKEHIWREWIEYNKNIINVYFFYKDYSKIHSEWIKQHAIPNKFILNTSYYHVVPAYFSLMNYAFNDDEENHWFCMLTDSCCPIIHPYAFRAMFYELNQYSIMSWKKAWWNPDFHKRGNLAKLHSGLHLANDPWFVLNRENVKQAFYFFMKQCKLTKTICDGGIANESLFAIIFKMYGKLETDIINEVTHLTEWTKPSSTTSPHLFKEGNDFEIEFIEKELERKKNAIFIRKIHPDFPDTILRKYIYNSNNEYNNPNYQYNNPNNQYIYQYIKNKVCNSIIIIKLCFIEIILIIFVGMYLYEYYR